MSHVGVMWSMMMIMMMMIRMILMLWWRRWHTAGAVAAMHVMTLVLVELIALELARSTLLRLEHVATHDQQSIVVGHSQIEFDQLILMMMTTLHFDVESKLRWVLLFSLLLNFMCMCVLLLFYLMSNILWRCQKKKVEWVFFESFVVLCVFMQEWALLLFHNIFI